MLLTRHRSISNGFHASAGVGTRFKHITAFSLYHRARVCNSDSDRVLRTSEAYEDSLCNKISIL